MGWINFSAKRPGHVNHGVPINEQLPYLTEDTETLSIFEKFLYSHSGYLLERYQSYRYNEKAVGLKGGIGAIVQAAFLAGAMYERARAQSFAKRKPGSSDR